MGGLADPAGGGAPVEGGDDAEPLGGGGFVVGGAGLTVGLTGTTGFSVFSRTGGHTRFSNFTVLAPVGVAAEVSLQSRKRFGFLV